MARHEQQWKLVMNWQIDTKSWSVSVRGLRPPWRPFAKLEGPSQRFVGRARTKKLGHYQLRLLEKGTSKLMRTHEFHALTRHDAIKVAVEAAWNAPMQLWHEGRMLHHWPAPAVV